MTYSNKMQCALVEESTAACQHFILSGGANADKESCTNTASTCVAEHIKELGSSAAWSCNAHSARVSGSVLF